MSLLLALLAGALLWTLAEYGLHRFVFHEMPGDALGAREHRMHHADPSWFAPWTQKALAALAVTAAILPLAWLGLGRAAGLAFTGGFVAMYLAYEVLHRRVHTHPPRGPYGRWRRWNHLAHHFTDPRRAHGVTSPLWDHVFGTALPRARVRVPRRLANAWMLDARGELRAGLGADYELVGAARRDAAGAPRAAG
ncbi:MAG: sterol desaturase family protein [Myxococcota bacterium]|nr:sterol desaturase family protein [Myxococcota bacterium]